MRKEFFKVPTKAQILGNDTVKEVESNLINEILSLYTDQAMIIKRRLIPEGYKGSRHFMKHGPEVKLKRQQSLSEMLKNPKRPLDLRQDAFSRIQAKTYSGLTFKPFIGTDKKTRKIPLVECLEGSKLYAYCHSDIAFRPHIEIKPYDDVPRVDRDGAEIVGHVPSREKGAGNYEIKFLSLPIADNDWKWGLANSISTTHDCKSKLFNIRYKFKGEKESSRMFNFCAHEFAMYMAIIDHYYTEEGNLVPIEQSHFPLPNQFTVDFYKKLDRNIVIQDAADLKPRRLNRADKEILLWGLVHVQGRDHGYDQAQDRTFYASEKLRDYDWS